MKSISLVCVLTIVVNLKILENTDFDSEFVFLLVPHR